MKNLSYYQLVSFTALALASASANACLTSEIESNNTESNTNINLCSNTLIEGTLSRNDIDWYEFDIASSGSIDISLNHNRRDDFDWALYQTSGGAVVTGETGNRPETGSYQASAAGTYFLKVMSYAGTGWYDLVIDFPQNTAPPSGGCEYGGRPSLSGSLQSFIVGNASDTCADLSADNGAVLLMGGGSDVDSAFSNRLVSHIGSAKDVVVIRSSGSDGYNDYLLDLMSADSVETLIIDTRSKANSAYADWVIRSAEFVFVAGGDQSDYLNQWEDTNVQSALQHVYDKGGVVGGTSAGMALMANSIYDPDNVAGAVSSEVVADFCDESLNFSNRFLSIPVLNNSLTDTHFQDRDRMGRAVVSLGYHASNFFNIAASESSSIFISADGNAVVDGNGEVYIISETAQTNRQTLVCGQPVRYNNLLRTKLLSGDTYNVFSKIHSGVDLNISINGNNNSFYSPNNPY